MGECEKTQKPIENGGCKPEEKVSRRGRIPLTAGILLAAVFAVFAVAGCGQDAKEEGKKTGGDKKTLSALKATEIKPDLLAPGVKLPGGVALPMIKVDAGTFTMSLKDEANWGDEVVHTVTLQKSFYIGMTEVTQRQWRAVMNSDPSFFKGDNLPVESVSWDDAMAFCDKLNELKLAPAGWMFTLPTETQWEYAARGGTKNRNYHYGDGNEAGCKYAGSDRLDEVGWYGDSSEGAGTGGWLVLFRRLFTLTGKQIEDGIRQACALIEAGYRKPMTRPVAKKRPNELGIYDMSGNVWEWCLDDYSGDSSKTLPEERLVISGSEKLPDGLEVGKPCPHCGQIVGEPPKIYCQYRTIRGGSWSKGARYCRIAARYYYNQSSRFGNIGFRVALVKEPVDPKHGGIITLLLRLTAGQCK